ncbi:hypothetical protein DH2020_015683 [Rehmannia glutinosa]|uniref:NAC domain-containing protein n=1 Tax=Rehmannia glutinosa TaxID=99300 RepID=A0ABR0WVX6_REHGL
MARTSLPPGFRFHPTDVELVMYYLKRKVLGKKLHLEAIAEVNIYKFSPWDLPDKSCLKSKDLEWFFFCPREKKYASGVRVKRATENGYWKTTGKDRPIRHNDKTVGTVKTLVFHLGHAPQGERTDWVLHEYRILDNQLAAAGVQTEEQSCPHVTGLFGSGSKSGLPLIEGPSPSSGHPTSEVFVEETDDEMDDFSGKGKNTIPCSNGYDIYNGLGDLEIWSRLNGDRLDFSGKQGANNSLENMLLPDNSTYIELDDFLPPLDCSAGVTGTVQSSVGDEIFGFYRHENVQQFDAGSSFTGMDQRATCTNQLPLLPEGSYDGDNCLDMLQMVNNPFYQGCNTAFDLDFALGQLDNEVDFTQDIERGSCAD